MLREIDRLVAPVSSEIEAIWQPSGEWIATSARMPEALMVELGRPRA